MSDRRQELIDAMIEYRRHTMRTLIDVYTRDQACGGLTFYVNHRVITEAIEGEHK
jgi:hypothetical protein